MLDQGLADVAFICSERRNMFVPTTNPVLSGLAIICPFSMCTELSVSHPDHSRGQGDVFIRLHILNQFLIPAALTDKSETFLEKGSGNENNGDL